jgi:hypothetical protein
MSHARGNGVCEDEDERALSAVAQSRNGSRGTGRTFLGLEAQASALDSLETGVPNDARVEQCTAAVPPTTIGARQEVGGPGISTPRAVAIAAAKKAGITGEGLSWEAGQGLAIDLRLTSNCLANSGGSFLAFIGFIMMVTGSTGWMVMGTFCLVGGLLIIFLVNKERCKLMFQLDQDPGTDKDSAKAAVANPAKGAPLATSAPGARKSES